MAQIRCPRPLQIDDVDAAIGAFGLETVAGSAQPPARTRGRGAWPNRAGCPYRAKVQADKEGVQAYRRECVVFKKLSSARLQSSSARPSAGRTTLLLSATRAVVLSQRTGAGHESCLGRSVEHEACPTIKKRPGLPAFESWPCETILESLPLPESLPHAWRTQFFRHAALPSHAALTLPPTPCVTARQRSLSSLEPCTLRHEPRTT